MKKILISLIAFATIVTAQDEFAISKSTIGGYGELHFNYKSLEQKKDEAPKLDFHRFVLFYGHQWNDQWSFKAEVELEHNFVKDGHGELELEQAYVNFKHSEAANYQFGVLLPSVGLLNENHEPPLFLSVERPEYSKHIIPTTWFGNGVAVTGVVAELVDYKVVVMEGLRTTVDADEGVDTKINTEGLRGGRQKGFDSSLENVLFNARADYVGILGLRAGASYSRNQLMKNNGHQTFNAINIFEGHVKYDANNIYAVAEGAYVLYDGLAGYDLETSQGYYAEAGYNVGSLIGCEKSKIIPWARYEFFNRAASYTNDAGDDEENATTKIAAGIAFKPIDEVVFKADYTHQTKGANDDVTHLIDLGVGYMF